MANEPGSANPPAAADRTMARNSAVMASGTIASRVTGVLRDVAMTAALGFFLVSDAFSLGNSLPTIVYILVSSRLRPGREPDEVMDAAIASLDGWHVDATDIAVIAGTPRILLRFTVPESSDAEENQAARLAAVGTRDAVDEVAGTGQLWVLRRRDGRWLPLS